MLIHEFETGVKITTKAAISPSDQPLCFAEV